MNLENLLPGSPNIKETLFFGAILDKQQNILL
jgi:hypothetical protein